MSNISNLINPTDSWIFHREEIDTIQDGSCNVYVLLDGNNGYCFGQEAYRDLPATNKIMDLLKNARSKNGN